MKSSSNKPLKTNKIADFLIAFTALFSIIILLAVLIGSLKQWSYAINSVETNQAKMFWCGLLIAIAYSTGAWMTSFINLFTKHIKLLFRKDTK